MVKNIKSVGVLVAICSVIALLLALTNQITAPIIEKNQSAAANAALLEVMPEGTGFELVDLSSYSLPATVTEAYKETSGKGYVIRLNATGWKPDMIIMCGVSADGVIVGATCLESSDTNGAEKTYGQQFIGKDAEGVDAVDTVGSPSAPLTRAGYKQAIKDALTAAINLGGGNAETRTPEQILQDNLAEALPAGEGKFTKLFFTEIVKGVDAVYAADNGAGYVAIIGEEFIAADAEGNSDNAVVATAAKTLVASTSTDVDLTAYEGLNDTITSIKKTATGNYDMLVEGLGYAYYDDNHGYGEQRFVPIMIRVSLTADGKIIDCLTVSHEESKGIGDVCGKEEYYSQFDGKTADTYTEVDGIAGATWTTEGYMDAIKFCFEAVTILEGGAK